MIRSWWLRIVKRLWGTKDNWWEDVGAHYSHYSQKQLDTKCAHCGQRFGRHNAFNGGCFSEAYTGSTFTPKEETK